MIDEIIGDQLNLQSLSHPQMSEWVGLKVPTF
uniref:Macaca fascicularis brain cDNA, clone: QflA-20977 n=1 Tax=Macaca fascicularis TaxID=9541 RepID=I7GM63_MACFA|nr:unnamed protein product [Macaca fascicularis]